MSTATNTANEPRVFATNEDVMAYYEKDKENHQVVIFEGKVYDVKEYMPDHPGGSDYIETNLGKNIEEPFEDAEHTKAAKKTLLKLPVVGVMETDSNSDDAATESKGAAGTKERVSNLFGEDFNSKHVFDYDKPLLW